MHATDNYTRWLNRLCDLLGYANSPSYLTSDRFHEARGSLFPLRNAAETMGVVGAFGRWESSVNSQATQQRFVPLVYVVSADNESHARELHRKIWSQGLVPLSLFVTPEYTYPSVGFEFSYDDWMPRNHRIQTSSLAQAIIAPPSLEIFHGLKLSSQIGIRDLVIHPEARVDRQLLRSLKGLRAYLSATGLQDPQLINLLIGRFLYLYVLIDRSLLPPQWLQKFGGIEPFNSDSKEISASICWKLFDAIDSLLNGTIFPITKEQRSLVSDSHVRALRDCLKLGHKFEGGGQQLSFIDFDLSTIQTETLSAIYEDFIDTEGQSRDSTKRSDGAFYTKPYLVDFLVDRVDEVQPISSATKVLDGTAGSGAFLVAAYRRIIERELVDTEYRALPAERLKQLLIGSIYGVEKNPSACAVAAFGLYLTMLDYADPVEVSSYLNGAQREKLFPPLIGRNLICADIFSSSLRLPKAWPAKFDAILGNPPWNKISEVTDEEGNILKEYGAQIDGKEAAEVALLLLMKRFIGENGISGLVIPTKSLIGPSSKRFPRALFNTYTITGIINLSHLRYRLFDDARQPASVVLLRGKQPDIKSICWTYSPLRPQLVCDKQSDIWFLSLDRSKIEFIRQHTLTKNDDALFSQLMLKPIDRHLREYIDDQIANGHLQSIGSWLDREDLGFERGGSPAQTRLPSSKLLGADKFKNNNYRHAPGIQLLRVNTQQHLINPARLDYVLTDKDLEKVPAGFKRMFLGNILLVPRSMKGIAYCSKPIAFGSSLNAVYSKSGKRGQKLLRAKLVVLGRFLCTDVAAYLFAVNGRQWILDQARLEKSDLLRIPFPFTCDWERLEVLSDKEFNQAVYEELNLDAWAKEAISEYAQFRVGYHDGKVPSNFSSPITVSENEDTYSHVMLAVLRQAFPRAQIKSAPPRNRFLTAADLVIQVNLDADRNVEPEILEGEAQKGVANDEMFLFSPNRWSGLIIKPNEKFRWTAESAYADSAHILRLLTA